jgi:hypothetical protein
MNLNSEFLFSKIRHNQFVPFKAVTDAHGQYSTFHFVLRLSPVVHRALASVPPGISAGPHDSNVVQAMSTLLHETVHWWQHIGSTYGFMLSLNYPLQTHINHHHLMKIIGDNGFKKSVLKNAYLFPDSNTTDTQETASIINRIVNNHYDLLAYRDVTLNKQAAGRVVNNTLFECVGHAFQMTIANTVMQLASTVDRDFKILPHPKEWELGFDDLRNRKVEGFYYGSPILQFPLGAHEIFEGQAAISQAQFLSYSCNHRVVWADLQSRGMLHGIYVAAFNEFLAVTQSVQPERFDDPLVGLFLLICDIALNPVAGFPLPVVNFESFIFDNNPGARFHLLCMLVRDRLPHLKSAIKQHSREEYVDVSDRLCEAAKDVSPARVAEFFGQCFAPNGPWRGLRREYETYEFDEANYVVRHLFAHFLAFQEDKHKRPEFFCWPGAWLAGKNVDLESDRLFSKHGALFGDKEDDDSIFPRLQRGRSEAALHKAFETFYQHSVIFDLTDQWISRSGPFRYDFDWLSSSASNDELKQFARGNFRAAFNVDPEDAELLA